MTTNGPGGDLRNDAAQILRARARALARPFDQAESCDASLKVLEFHRADERYAVETRYVREVYRAKQLTPVPSAPAFVLGIINLRGRIVPVFDVKVMFDAAEPRATGVHSVVVVAGLGLELGLAADATAGVRLLPLDVLQPSLSALSGLREEYLKAVTVDRIAVLDLERILADPRIIVRDDFEG